MPRRQKGVRQKIADILSPPEDDSIQEALDQAAEDSGIPEQVNVPPAQKGGVTPDRAATVAGAVEQGAMDEAQAAERLGSYIDPALFEEDPGMGRDAYLQEVAGRASGQTTSWSPKGDPYTYELHTGPEGQYILATHPDKGTFRVAPGDRNPVTGVDMFEAILATQGGDGGGEAKPPTKDAMREAKGAEPEPPVEGPAPPPPAEGLVEGAAPIEGPVEGPAPPSFYNTKNVVVDIPERTKGQIKADVSAIGNSRKQDFMEQQVQDVRDPALNQQYRDSVQAAGATGLEAFKIKYGRPPRSAQELINFYRSGEVPVS